MGCDLEIGRVNKEWGVVSFTWLILLTIQLALSHAPFLILYFSHATYTTPLSPVSFPLSSILLVFSAPSSAFLSQPSHHICAHGFQRLQLHSGCQKCPSPADWRALSHSVFSVLLVLIPSRGISRWIFLLVCIIAQAWYEILHWLHRFKTQSVALCPRSRIINKPTYTLAVMFTNSYFRWQT